eukprot:3099508-Amphidinium_carterae.1
MFCSTFLTTHTPIVTFVWFGVCPYVTAKLRLKPGATFSGAPHIELPQFINANSLHAALLTSKWQGLDPHSSLRSQWLAL